MGKYFFLLLNLFFFTALVGDETLLEPNEHQDFKSKMIHFLSENPGFKARFHEQIADLHVGEDEQIIIEDILQIIQPDSLYLKKILRGAHVRIHDNGESYFKWRELPSAHARVSSHSCLPGSYQYGIMGPISHEILFGIHEVNEELFTFFQLENTPWAPGLNNRVYHTMDALQFLISGKNIGPYGMSEHHDKNPLILY